MNTDTITFSSQFIEIFDHLCHSFLLSLICLMFFQAIKEMANFV